MRILVDTAAFLHWTSGAARMSPRARKAFADGRNELFLSAISSWEIAIKHGLGKLELPEAPATFVPSRMAKHGLVGLPFEHVDALAVASLPLHHDDPFDRALIAQAKERSLAVMTPDERFAEYGVRVVW